MNVQFRPIAPFTQAAIPRSISSRPPVKGAGVRFGNEEPQDKPPAQPIIVYLPLSEEELAAQEGRLTKKQARKAGLTGFVGGVLGSLLTVGSLITAVFLVPEPTVPKRPDGMPPTSPVRTLQGQEQNSMTAERLEQRNRLQEALQNGRLERGEDLSMHLFRLGQFGKPAVVYLVTFYDRGVAHGSGFLYREDGIIVTNDHVVPPDELGSKLSRSVEVFLYDGTPVVGTVIGRRPDLDLAVIKISKNNLPVLSFATETPKPGELVMAIGHPPELGWSISLGIISGDGRRGFLPSTSLVQTDAAINMGNSGGPLLNMRGQVLAVNEAIMGGGLQNLGLSLPASSVQQAVDEILAQFDRVQRK